MRGGGGGGALRGTWRVAAGLLLLWVLILLYMSASLYQSGDLSERTERQLQKAMQELDSLKLQNTQLQNLAAELRWVSEDRRGAGGGQPCCSCEVGLGGFVGHGGRGVVEGERHVLWQRGRGVD